MILNLLFKVFGDLLLYVGFLSGIPAWFPVDVPCLLAALLWAGCAALAAVLQRQGMEKLRYFAAALSLCALLLAGSIAEALVLLPGLMYTIMLIYRGAFTLEYYGFRDFYGKALGALSVYAVLIWGLSSMEAAGRAQRPSLNPEAVVRCAVAFAFAGVLLLRRLRMGADRQGRQMSRNQMAAILVCVALSVVGLVLLERSLQAHATSLLKLLWDGVAALVSLPMALLSLFSKARFDEPEYTVPPQTQETQPPQPTIEMFPQETLGEELATQANQMGLPWLLVLMLLAAATCMLILLLRQFRHPGAGSEHRQTIETIRPQEREKQPSRRGPRQRVRRAYREFLKNEIRKGRKIEPYQTSQELARDTAYGTRQEGAWKLRSVYIQARYDEAADVTQEQVEAAKAALKEYKGG